MELPTSIDPAFIVMSLPFIAIVLSPLFSDERQGGKLLGCVIMFCNLLAGPIILGMWGIVGTFVHLLSDVCLGQHSILWHIIPSILTFWLRAAFLIPWMESYTGRKF